MKSKQSRIKGFTMVEIMIVVAIIGLLATIAIPQWVHARATSQTNTCINNLRQIDGAVQQWALENKEPSTASVSPADVLLYLKNAVICPAGGKTFDDSYALATVADKPTCKQDAVNHVLPVEVAD
jgi:prepilin-type N-terminal cleavage/methylation domain-containing protein